MGRGLAVRLSAGNDVLIGSRSKERAEIIAGELGTETKRQFAAGSNAEVALDCDIAILAIPDLGDDSFYGELMNPLGGKVVVSPIVPMASNGGMMTHALKEGSAAEHIASILKESRVVAAFHNLPAKTLQRIERTAEFDVLVACDNQSDYDAVASLIHSVEGLRPIYVGPLSAARVVEEITPLLLNAAKLNGLKRLSIRLVS